MKTRNVTNGLLEGVATKLIEGGLQYAESLDLGADFVTAITADRDGLDSAINIHTERKAAETSARAVRNTAIRSAQKFVMNTMQALRLHLGNTYTSSWDRAGVPQGSIAVPRSLDELTRRINSLKNYLTVNPTHEVAAANVTAIAAVAAGKAMADANGALQAAIVARQTAGQQVEYAQDQLARRLRMAEEALGKKLGADDLRWHGFGLPRPIDTRIPEVPAAPVLKQTDRGTLELSWTRAVRARRYRIFLQMPEDAEPRAIETVPVLYAIVRDLPTGVKLQFTLVAANGSGESQASEPAEITLT